MTIILNDTHLGAIRSAGTTIASSQALRAWQLQQFGEILDEVNEDIIILGDLYDTYNVAASDILTTYQHLTRWLTKGHTLIAVPGNHDKSKDSSKLSSFEFMCKLLLENKNVRYLEGSGWANNQDTYIISHLLNQDLLDMELKKVPQCKYLLVHTNYNNGHAVHSDHSLNITEQQVRELPCEFVVFAHEHSPRTALEGKVFICGVQTPSSVSDCLDGKDKFMTRLADKPERVKTWAASSYQELDWRNPTPSEANFIRFTGHCKPEEAADMADTIARYRKSSTAFVVSNAVKVSEDTEGNELALESLEEINRFNVMEALKSYLTEEEVQILEKLNAETANA